QLAKLYLRVGNLSAAEAEAHEAQRTHGDDEVVAPILAQTLIQEGKLNELLEQVQPADREAKAEASVRLALGLGHLALGETDKAKDLLADAERFAPDDWGPKIAIARLDMLGGDVQGA